MHDCSMICCWKFLIFLVHFVDLFILGRRSEMMDICFSTHSWSHIPGTVKFRGPQFHVVSLTTVPLNMWSPDCSTASPGNLLPVHICRPSPRLTASEILGWSLRNLCLASPPCDAGSCSSLRTAALELLGRKPQLALILKEFLSDPPNDLFFITGCLSIEMGPTVSPKLRIFQPYLSFTARLFCSGGLAEPHQQEPP